MVSPYLPSTSQDDIWGSIGLREIYLLQSITLMMQRFIAVEIPRNFYNTGSQRCIEAIPGVYPTNIYV